MTNVYRNRRVTIFIISLIIFAAVIITSTPNYPEPTTPTKNTTNSTLGKAIDALSKLVIKGRAPKTDYTREQFGSGWKKIGGCDMREIILNRDLLDVIINDECQVISGTLNDPYTGKTIRFIRGSNTSGAVQIDHVVALSDAWQKGAQAFTLEKRIQLANDPLDLLAVDGVINQQKGDGDAATWLPPNKSFRCQYVSRQIAVKQKYGLWVTQAEYDAMSAILSKCPGQLLPSP